MKGLHLILIMLTGTCLAQAQRLYDSSLFIQPADSSVLLDAITVEAYQLSGRLRTIPGSISVLTGKEIGVSDGTNLAYSLNTLPGVYMHSGTYTTNRIVIRGMGSRTPYNTNRIRAYLNDIPLTSSDGISSPEEIDLQALGRIEIVKGPSSALYGSGLGGSLNQHTRTANHNAGSAILQYGSFNTVHSSLSGNYITERSEVLGHIGYLHSDGYRENNRYDRLSFLSTAGWRKTGWSLDLTLLLMGVNAGIPSSLGKTMYEQDPQAAAPTWNAIGGYKRYFKGIAGITFTRKLSARWTNKLILFGRDNDSYEKRPFNNLDDRSISAGLRNKLSFYGTKTNLVLGLEWIREQYDWKLDLDGTLLNMNRENRSHLNVFAMAYYKPYPRLNISVAGALNHITYRLTDLYEANGDQSGSRNFPLILSPRIGINYSPVLSWAIYASAGHGFSLPSPEETLLPEGDVNHDIRPEQGYQFEVGTRMSIFDKKLELDATFYWIELKDLLVSKRVAEDVFTGMNAGKTRHLGFEMLVHSNIFTFQDFPGKLSAVFSYTGTLDRFIEFTDDTIVYDGNRLPGIPDQSVHLQLVWIPMTIFEMSADFHYTGDQYLDDGNTLSNPGFFLSNLKLTALIPVKKSDVLRLHAGINNLTNVRYASMLIVNAQGFGGAEPRYYYPGLPRHFYAGIHYTF